VHGSVRRLRVLLVVQHSGRVGVLGALGLKKGIGLSELDMDLGNTTLDKKKASL
jgi:hypothetical protein